MRLLQIGLIVITVLQRGSPADASVKPDHPRLIVESVPTMAQSCLGPLAEDYRVQYNHQNERGKKPPICPWRIEVADPSQGARTMFLHVFEITDENNQTPTAIKLIEPEGVQIGEKWQVRFNASGPLAGRVGDRALSTEIHTESQYQ